FEDDDVDDLAQLFTNPVHLLRLYRLRARNAEDETATIEDKITGAEATFARLRQLRTELQTALAAATRVSHLDLKSLHPKLGNHYLRTGQIRRIPDPPMVTGTRASLSLSI
ncbi:hypothetical protein Q9L58_010293, partial [Maublancomyces gigas]